MAAPCKEMSLVLVKPDGVVRRQAGVEALKALLALPDVHILTFKHVVVPDALARLHYLEHTGKSFFNFLLEMVTAPAGVLAMVFEGEGLVQKVRDLFGPTFIDKALLKPGLLLAQTV